MNARPVSMPAFVDIHMSIPNHWKRILVPTDFSEDALTAMLEAQRFQQHSEAEVVLLHVTEPAFEGLRIHSGDLRDQMAAARHQIEALAIAYFGSKDSATTLIKEGHAGEVICEMARELNADVIFIATQGITALKHFMLGSVAESVVRHAPCSVLVVR